MLGIDQTGVRERSVGGPCRIDPFGGVGRFDIEGNGDDGEAKRCEFSVERLPPGQAGAAASITRPGDQQHLAAMQR